MLIVASAVTGVTLAVVLALLLYARTGRLVVFYDPEAAARLKADRRASTREAA